MFEYLESISITEGEQIKKTIQALFRQTCILQVKYDPATLVPKDNVQYEICVRHRHFIEDYLSVLGCELTHDAQEHIFCLTGDGAAREKLNMTETVILLIIKLIYKDKIMGEGLNAPVTTLKEMREYGKNTNLIVRKLKADEWKASLYLMRLHQIIDRFDVHLPGTVQAVPLVFHLAIFHPLDKNNGRPLLASNADHCSSFSLPAQTNGLNTLNTL